MNISLVRHAYLPDMTLGYLFVGRLMLATLEEPWKPTEHGSLPGSCVPDGYYTLVPHNSEAHPNSLALINVTQEVFHEESDVPQGAENFRTEILIHSGNTVSDTKGCILVGLRHGDIGAYPESVPAVLESRNALAQMMGVLGSGLHTLTIRPTAGTIEVTP